VIVSTETGAQARATGLPANDRSAGPTRAPTWGQWFRDSFLAGLLVLAPLSITLYILWFVFDHVDAPLGDRINALIHRATGIAFHIPGLGILATVALVLAIGAVSRFAVFRFALGTVEGWIERLPLVRSLYNASRQIVVPFTEEGALPFSDVVLVEYPMPGRFTLGMIARQRVTSDPHDDRIVVFFPTNHLHLGYPVILRRHEVTRIDMSVEEAIKFFVSCGSVAEDRLFQPSEPPPVPSGRS
jgi:uncharacterized membrane protein